MISCTLLKAAGQLQYNPRFILIKLPCCFSKLNSIPIFLWVHGVECGVITTDYSPNHRLYRLRNRDWKRNIQLCTLRVMKCFDEIFHPPETRSLGPQQCDLA